MISLTKAQERLPLKDKEILRLKARISAMTWLTITPAGEEIARLQAALEAIRRLSQEPEIYELACQALADD